MTLSKQTKSCLLASFLVSGGRGKVCFYVTLFEQTKSCLLAYFLVLGEQGQVCFHVTLSGRTESCLLASSSQVDEDKFAST